METPSRNINNAACLICSCADREEDLMLCEYYETCGHSFHYDCLNLKRVPEDEFVCKACQLRLKSDAANAEARKKAEEEALRKAKTPTIDQGSRIVLYARVSSEGQDDPEFGRVGLFTQNHSLLEFSFKKNAIVCHTDTEVGSARKTGRKGIRAAINKLHEGEFLVVYAVDRFCRNLSEGLDLLEEIHRRGACVYSVHEDVYSYQDEFINLMQNAQATSDRFSANRKASIARQKMAGGHVGPAPFGFDVVRDPATGLRRLQEDPDLVGWVRDIIDATDPLKLANIANKLNELELFNRGKMWTMGTIKACHKRLVDLQPTNEGKQEEVQEVQEVRPVGKGASSGKLKRAGKKPFKSFAKDLNKALPAVDGLENGHPLSPSEKVRVQKAKAAAPKSRKALAIAKAKSKAPQVAQREFVMKDPRFKEPMVAPQRPQQKEISKEVSEDSDMSTDDWSDSE
jgi:DNA invertase Pin-like site-specific DNA recombinase